MCDKSKSKREAFTQVKRLNRAVRNITNTRDSIIDDWCHATGKTHRDFETEYVAWQIAKKETIESQLNT